MTDLFQTIVNLVNRETPVLRGLPLLKSASKGSLPWDHPPANTYALLSSDSPHTSRLAKENCLNHLPLCRDLLFSSVFYLGQLTAHSPSSDRDPILSTPIQSIERLPMLLGPSLLECPLPGALFDATYLRGGVLVYARMSLGRRVQCNHSQPFT